MAPPVYLNVCFDHVFEIIFKRSVRLLPARPAEPTGRRMTWDRVRFGLVDMYTWGNKKTVSQTE